VQAANCKKFLAERSPPIRVRFVADWGASHGRNEAMTVGKISTEQRDHVWLMGIDRATKRNAFDVPMYHALAKAFYELHHRPELRCGVLFAHGDHFTAGLDLPQFTPMFAQGKWEVPEGSIDPLGLTGTRVSKPVICALQGYCLTIGIELLLACDIRIAQRSTQFGQIEIKRGIYPVGGATVRLPREVGWGNAMRYLLTGDMFSADEAYRIGMIQEVVDDGQVLSRALELATTVAEQAPLGVQATLTSSRCMEKEGEEKAIARLFPDIQPILKSKDVQEGVASFLERRKAKFTGE
jgi:enoyl-CoA hydratase